ncbi:MAG: hypothetical protein LBS74_10965 [Oscillospiraceae bacterium]|jgi:hypothetical protein|nr:hypothetical protein [Oscillospiraceae bacterium]
MPDENLLLKLKSIDQDFEKLQKDFTEAPQPQKGGEVPQVLYVPEDRFTKLEREYTQKQAILQAKPQAEEYPELEEDEEEYELEAEEDELGIVIARRKRKAYIFGSVLVLLIIGGLLFTSTLLPDILYKKDYEAASLAAQQGDFPTAIAKLNTLGDYQQSRSLLQGCRYRYAQALIEERQYSEALELLAAVGEFEDSRSLSKECKYQLAKEQIKANPTEAAKLFLQIPSYKDVKQLLSTQLSAAGAELITKEDYKNALEFYTAAEGIKDRAVYIAICKTYLWEGESTSLDTSALSGNFDILEKAPKGVSLAQKAAASPIYHFIRLSGVWATANEKYFLKFGDKFELNLPIAAGTPKLRIKGAAIERCDNLKDKNPTWQPCLEILSFEPESARAPSKVRIKNLADGEEFELTRNS